MTAPRLAHNSPGKGPRGCAVAVLRVLQRERVLRMDFGSFLIGRTNTIFAGGKNN